MKEEWKDIVGYEGLYQVSNLGRARSFKWGKEKILKQPLDSKGYKTIFLCSKGKQATKRTHRLIAETFIPNPENKPFINHINGVKTDNRIENLEWCTPNENIQHAFRTGLNKGLKSKQSPRSRQVLQYDLQGNFIKEWDCITDCERELKINHSHISGCCRGRYKTAHGYKWKYKDIG